MAANFREEQVYVSRMSNGSRSILKHVNQEFSRSDLLFDGDDARAFI
jgi:hypothetical protein